jgi:tRNA(Ile2)-agmatinylcytidine synthase
VRLNPNVPWKTRGNGALAFTFEGDLPLETLLQRVRALVLPLARHEEGTSPGIVVSRAPLDPALYTATVTRIVERDEAAAAIAAAGGLAWGGRGVIGASAAIAWPAERATWERIAYRDEARIGTPRDVLPKAVREVEEQFPSIFDSYDLIEDDIVCVPSSPCPVLWGLRGEDPRALETASRIMGPERPSHETLFLTNQGSDDHLRDGTFADARAFGSLRARASVAARPREHGGHVWLELADETGTMRAAAYAPTRSFRSIVSRLAAGDDITVCGGLHAGPDGRLTLGIEKMRVHATAPRKVANPRCPSCGAAMKSAGRGAGWRCRPCGVKTAAAVTADAGLAGWYEVPSSARRHLAMPLKRVATGWRGTQAAAQEE